MKKVLLGLVLLFGAVNFSSAQVNPHAIGIRGGYGWELSYQHGMGPANRLEFDLGLGNYGFDLTGAYHWDWNIVSGLNWFVGPGATVGFWGGGNKVNGYNGNGYLNLGVGGQIGLEFDFKKIGAPILLSLDSRPMWNFNGYNGGFGWGADFGVRYVW